MASKDSMIFTQSTGMRKEHKQTGASYFHLFIERYWHSLSQVHRLFWEFCVTKMEKSILIIDFFIFISITFILIFYLPFERCHSNSLHFIQFIKQVLESHFIRCKFE